MKGISLSKDNLNFESLKKVYDLLRLDKFEKKKIIISLSISVFLVSLLLIFSIITTLGYDNVYNRVYIKGEDFGNLTKKEAQEKFNSNVFTKTKNVKISLESGGKNLSFKLGDIGINYDPTEITDKIYSIGRSGNFLNRIVRIIDLQLSKNDLSYIEYSYNDKDLDKRIDNFYKMTYKPSKEYSFEIDEKKSTIVINSGYSEEHISKQDLKKQILSVISYGKNTKITLEKKKYKQKSINIEDIYSKITKKAVDATIKVTNGKNYTFVEPKKGIEINKDLLQSELKKIDQKENESVELPISFIESKVSVEQLKSKLFKDNLANYQTTFGSGDVPRNTNIELASSAINNIIIMPNCKFSFNDVVGVRTTAKGYQTAAVYADGKVTTGIGGGICQVSTTIHNAVLRQADMDIIDRSNHMFTVGYVPLGYDAAVSYGSVDYAFKNNSNYPIRLDVSTIGNCINASIIGTKENNKTVSLSTTGSGLNWNTYRTIKDGDTVISSKLLYSSTYKPH